MTKMEEQRCQVIAEIDSRHSHSDYDHLLDHASILGKLGLVLSTYTEAFDSSLISPLAIRAWEEGLLKSRPGTSPDDFIWTSGDSTEVVGVKSHFAAFILPDRDPESRLTNQRSLGALHDKLMAYIKACSFTSHDVEDLRRLITMIAVAEAEKALEAVSIPWDELFETTTYRINLSDGVRDDFYALVKATAQVTSLRNILKAIQAAISDCKADLENNPQNDYWSDWEWADSGWRDFEENALQHVIGNLQRLINGDEWLEGSKINIDTLRLYSVTNLVFLHCLDLAPLAATTSPAVIKEALERRTIHSRDRAATRGVYLDDIVLNGVTDYALSNNVAVSDVVKNALHSYLT